MNKLRMIRRQITEQVNQVRASLAAAVEAVHGSPRYPIDKIECCTLKLAILQALQSELVIEQMAVETELRALEREGHGS
jgi:hypothetical protein